MTKEEYITTFTIDGKRVDVGIDDYCQCYFLEWEENGEKKEVCLGTYNTEIVEGVFYYLDPVYRNLWNRMYNDDFTESEKKLLDAYVQMINEIWKDML